MNEQITRYLDFMVDGRHDNNVSKRDCFLEFDGTQLWMANYCVRYLSHIVQIHKVQKTTEMIVIILDSQLSETDEQYILRWLLIGFQTDDRYELGVMHEMRSEYSSTNVE